ncbi:hypothetical protein ES708_21339 [subsurface metagenome]
MSTVAVEPGVEVKTGPVFVVGRQPVKVKEVIANTIKIIKSFFIFFLLNILIFE